MRLAVITVAGLLLVGCGMPVEDRQLDGPYRLRATDLTNERVICYGQDPCETRIPARVYAVGYDDRYLVAIVNPLNAVGSVTDEEHYYYIDRAADGPTADASTAVHGPLDEQAFQAANQRLGFPHFKKIDHLKNPRPF